MSSNFAFGFSGHDIDVDDDENEKESDVAATADPDHCVKEAPLIPPEQHTLKEMLSALPSCISYNEYNLITHSPSPPESTGQTPTASNLQLAQADKGRHVFQIRKRSLFDALTQLKAEADIEDAGQEDAASHCPPRPTGYSRLDKKELIATLEGGNPSDLLPRIYEGGFKAWECGLDLARFLASQIRSGAASDEFAVWLDGSCREGFEVIELGAGTAFPALFVLGQVLDHRLRKPWQTAGSAEGVYNGQQRSRFVLCDYNIEVLRLVTTANVLLHICKATDTMRRTESERGDGVDSDDEGELDDITPDLCQNLLHTLDKIGVDIDFTSGAWGAEFVNTILPPPPSANTQETNISSSSSSSPSSSRRRPILILASETIYSLDQLTCFTETMLSLLRRGGTGSKALVAAKKIYFGVGGGADLFTAQVRSRGGTLNVVRDVNDDHGGVGRVIFQVTVSQT